MKLVADKFIFLQVIAITVVISAAPLGAEVYKVVDKDGNVSYTDKPLENDAELVKLRPISVIEAPTYQLRNKADTEAEQVKEIPLKTLRKNYKDFKIISPQPEQSFWGPENNVAVAWNTRYQLLEGMQVVIYVDADEFTRTTQRSSPLDGLVRGEHLIEADLIDKNGERISTAEPVTFFLRRANIHSNRSGPTPRSGG